jgi:hypothetical protein
MRSLKQSTAANVMVLMVDSTDHVTGKTGLTLTVTASKDGAAFASISPTVTERTSGWYSIALTTAHTDTLGDLVIRCTGTAADPGERILTVTGGLVDADVTSRLASGSYTAPLDAAGVRTAVGLASANLDTQLTAIDDFLDTEVAAIYTRIGAPAGASIAADIAAVKVDTAAIDDYLDTEVAAIYARIGAPAGASIAADIAAVKSDTAAVLDDTGASGVVIASGSKSGYVLASTGLDSVVIETGCTARQALSVIAAATAGQVSGAGTGTVTIKGAGVATTRVVATTDADGNRSVVTLSLPS